MIIIVIIQDSIVDIDHEFNNLRYILFNTLVLLFCFLFPYSLFVTDIVMQNVMNTIIPPIDLLITLNSFESDDMLQKHTSVENQNLIYTT